VAGLEEDAMARIATLEATVATLQAKVESQDQLGRVKDSIIADVTRTLDDVHVKEPSPSREFLIMGLISLEG
jgi:hypothetical protein